MQKSWANPFEKIQSWRRSKIDIFIVQKGLFSIQNIYYLPNIPFLSLFFVAKRLNKEQTMKEFQIFDLNHGLTSLKISNIVDYLKSTFLQFRKLLSMQKHTILLYCRLSKINIFIVYCNPLYRENDNNYQVSAEIPIIGIFTRSSPRKFVSLSNLLDIRRMFIWRERPVSRQLHAF